VTERAGEIMRVGEVKLVREGEDTENQLASVERLF
jgi:hypothetical protein